MEISYKNVFISAACVAAVAGVGYALYFDYKRRTDSGFRKELKKKKNSQKALNKSDERSRDKKINDSAKKLAEIYNMVKGEPIPRPEEFEGFFFNQLNKSEQLYIQGPDYYEASAIEIFRAVLACPNPVDVILMLESAVPKPVNEIVLALFSLEMQLKREEFLDFYEKYPSNKNVKLVEDPVQPKSAADGIKKYHQVALKSFEAGEVIYTEKPLASALVPSLEGKGFCSVCFKKAEESVKHSFLENTYCSQTCFKIAENEFPKEVPTKGNLDLLTHFNKEGRMVASMFGRILSKAFHRHETGAAVQTDPQDFGPIQHSERYMPIKHTQDADTYATEVILLQDYLQHRTTEVEQVITPEYYKTTISKFMQACFAVANASDDADVISCPKTTEPLRYVVPGPFTGCAFYALSAYLNSGLAEANCQVEFREGDYVLSLVATKPIKAGEGLIVSSFDASSAKAEAVANEDDIPTEADFPPLVAEEKSEDTQESSFAEIDYSIPSYADVLAEDSEAKPSENLELPSEDNQVNDSETLSEDKQPENSDVPFENEPSDEAEMASEHESTKDSEPTTEDKLVNTSESVPSYAQIAKEDPVVSPSEDELPQESSEVKSSQAPQAPSYADIAAEEPAKDSDVIVHEDLNTSQEYEKLEDSTESA